jgi:RNA polymerase sigma-70 factor (ECF subfamily)
VDEKSDHLETCMALFAEHQRRLFLFINAMVPSPADAEEILQETSIVIWKKIDSYEAGTDFLAWCYRIAQLQTLAYRKKYARRMLKFPEDVAEQLYGKAMRHSDVLEARREALRACREKLLPEDRSLLDRCYGPDSNVAELAEELGRPATSIYRTLRRIRRQLAACIDQ